jgi:hypothetical protein
VSELYTGTGTLSDGKVVVLDNPVPLPSSRVRVTVEALSEIQPEGNFLAKLNAIRERLGASGYRFRTNEEIDAQIRAERESWER